MSGQLNSLRTPVCGYCRQNGHTRTDHDKKECPIIAKLAPCQYCGASGNDNHTETYCKERPIVPLQPIPWVMASILAMHKDIDHPKPDIDVPPPSIFAHGTEYLHRSVLDTARSQPPLQRHSNIQMTPTKCINSMGTSPSILMSSHSASNSLTPNTDDLRFTYFMDSQILQSSPTAFAQSLRRGNRIASTPSAMPSSSVTCVSSTARRRISLESAWW